MIPPTLAYFNALGLQASAVGNHEFDKGLDNLTGRVSQTADFPYLAANVVDKATGEPVPDPDTIVTTEDGVKIGVIGTVTQETPKLTDPSSLAGVNFTDPVEATNKYADQLSDGNPDNGEADIIVAEYHEGVDQTNVESDPIVTQTDADVDVIFTGHTHEEYVINAQVPGVADRIRPVVQTGNYGDNLGKVELEYGADGSVLVTSAELVEASVTPSAETVAARSPDFTAPATPSFSDVPVTHPFYKEIEWMKAEGISTGWPDETFLPQESANRDAIAAFFYRAAGRPAYVAPAVSSFSDVAPSDQFYKEISWLASSGITTGWSDGSFRPVTPVARDAMAALLYRYINDNVGRGGEAVFSQPLN